MHAMKIPSALRAAQSTKPGSHHHTPGTRAACCICAQGPGQFELQYEGEWVQGRREGLGTRYYHNNESYSGQFVANIRHGFGRYFFNNGDVYAGEWVDDRRTGRGTYYHANGDIFVGEWSGGLHVFCTLYLCVIGTGNSAVSEPAK